MLLNSGPLNTAALNAVDTPAGFAASGAAVATAQAALGNLQKTLAASRQAVATVSGNISPLVTLAAGVASSAVSTQAGLNVAKSAAAAAAATVAVAQASLDLSKVLAAFREAVANASGTISYLKAIDAAAAVSAAVSSAVVRTDLKELGVFQFARAFVFDAALGDLNKTLAANATAAASGSLGPILQASVVAGATAHTAELGDLQKTLHVYAQARAYRLTAFFGIAELDTRRPPPNQSFPGTYARAHIFSAYLSGGGVEATPSPLSATATVLDAGLMEVRLTGVRFATATATANLGDIPQALGAAVTARASAAGADLSLNYIEVAAARRAEAQLTTAQLRTDKPLAAETSSVALLLDAGLMQARLSANILASVVAQAESVSIKPVAATLQATASVTGQLSTLRELRGVGYAESLAYGSMSTTEKPLSAVAQVSAFATTDANFAYQVGALVFARSPLALRQIAVVRPMAAQLLASATLSPATLRTDYKDLARVLSAAATANGALGALTKPLGASAVAAATTTPLLGIVQPIAAGVQAVVTVSVNLVLNLREVAGSGRASAQASAVLRVQKVAQGATTARAVVTGELSVTHLGVSATARATTQAVLSLGKPVGASGAATAAVVDAGLGQARLAASKTVAATASVSTVAARPLATTGTAAAVVVDAALGQVRLSADATARATITPVGLSLNKAFSASRVAQANQVAAGLSIDQLLLAVVRAEVTAAADLRLDLKELRRTVAAVGTAQASLGDLNKTLSAQRAAVAVAVDAGLSQARLSATVTARAAVSAAGLESSKPLEVQGTANATVTDAGLMQKRLSAAATTSSSALATARMRWACQAQVLARATPSAASSVIRPAAAQTGVSATATAPLALVKRFEAPVSASAQATGRLLLGNEMLALVDAGASAAGDIQIDKPLSGETTTAAVPDVDLRLDKFLEGQGAAVALPVVKLRSAYPGIYIDRFTVYGPDVYVDDVTAKLSVDSIYADVEVIFVDYRKAA